ncbi:MAG: non-canonical purine NTP diphosphatase [Bacteroidales bacterium]
MKIVFATNNPNKLRELQQIVGDKIEIISLSEIGCSEDIPETQPTIEGNALQKARYVKEKYGYDCFADDTGLEINALNGEPGVYSARYAGEQKSAEDNIKLVLHKLVDIDNRSARFVTVIALVFNGKEHTFEGEVRGSIMTEQHGESGFGYDPIFKPEGYDITFAEMDKNTKNEISHRGKATQKILTFLASEAK